MQVIHRYRIWASRRVIEKGLDSNPAVYTALQRFGFHWIMPFLVALEQQPSMSPAHPSGESWRFELLVDYRRGENTPPTSATLFVLPRLSRYRSIVIPLRPEVCLTLADIECAIRQYVS